MHAYRVHTYMHKYIHHAHTRDGKRTYRDALNAQLLELCVHPRDVHVADLAVRCVPLALVALIPTI